MRKRPITKSRRRWPRRTRRRRPTTSLPSASRSTAASVTRGRTTPTCICGGPRSTICCSARRDSSASAAPTSTSRACRSPALRAHVLGQVVLDADLLDEAQLRFEPISMLFLAFEDLLEQVAAAVVAFGRACCDACVEPLDRSSLELEIEAQLLRDV